MIRSTLPLTALLLTLGACSSVAPQFYTLVTPAPESSTPESAQFQIEVLPVDIPAQVEVPQMVVREGSGQMTKVETRRWIAPLDAEIRSALSADLSRALKVRDVYGLSFGNAVKTYRVTLKVQRFDSALGAYARIDAVWTLQALDQPKAVSTCGSSVSQSVAPGFDALAQGHQQAIATIAAQIAAGISALQSGRSAAVCPV